MLAREQPFHGGISPCYPAPLWETDRWWQSSPRNARTEKRKAAWASSRNERLAGRNKTHESGRRWRRRDVVERNFYFSILWSPEKRGMNSLEIPGALEERTCTIPEKFLGARPRSTASPPVWGKEGETRRRQTQRNGRNGWCTIRFLQGIGVSTPDRHSHRARSGSAEARETNTEVRNARFEIWPEGHCNSGYGWQRGQGLAGSCAGERCRRRVRVPRDKTTARWRRIREGD